MADTGNPFDVDQLVREIIDLLNAELKEPITKYVAYAERQTKGLAMQGAWIAKAVLQGDIDTDQRDWFLRNLEDLSRNFAMTVATLTLLTIEQAWNAIVAKLWKTIGTAINAALPIPGLPVPV